MTYPKGTYTYVVLDVSPAAYEEIAAKLRAAGYDHLFDTDADGRTVIDMHGLAIGRADEVPLGGGPPVRLPKE